MSVSPSQVLRAPQIVAVAPTETTVVSLTRLELRTAKRVTIQVINLDGSQTFVGVVYRRQSGMSEFAPSSLPDFAAVGPGVPVMADIDVEGTDELELRGTASGAGLDVEVGVTRKAASP